MTTDDKQNGALLRQVQALDLQIDALRAQADLIPQQFAQWNDTIQAREFDKALFLRQREDLELKQRKFEAEIDARQEKREKYNQQLTLIKTNREYRALLEELDGVNTEIRNIEEIVLNTMTDMEAVDEELQRQQEAIQAEQAKIEANRARLENDLAELERQIAAKREERERLVADVEPRLMARYDRVRSRRGGEALAELDLGHGVCGGCHLALTPQEINEILGGALVPCSSCGRLLYNDEQAAESTTA